MWMDYYSDIGFTIWSAPFEAVQTTFVNTAPNNPPLTVLSSLLPVINNLVFSSKLGCLIYGIKPRHVLLTLQDDTIYSFDIPFSSIDTANYSTLLSQLNNPLIKNWEIVGEKIFQYRLPALLAVVP